MSSPTPRRRFFEPAEEALFYPVLTLILGVILATLLWGAPALFVAAALLTPVAFVGVISLTLQRAPAQPAPLPAARKRPH